MRARNWVGSSVRRKEDERLLTGRGRYVADVTVPGMLHAAFLRATMARATITSVDTSAAAALPGVAAVFTWRDFDGQFGEAWQSITGEAMPIPPPLAITDVRYVGDPIAVVVAESRYLAEDAAELIEVELDPAAPCADFRAAAADRDHLVHAAAGGESNILRETPFTALQPDLDQAFASARHDVEADIRSHRYVAVPMEARGIVAAWSPAADALDVTIANQKVHQAREFLARFGRVPPDRVRVRALDVGGSFGQKGFVFREECAVVLAARLAGRPVKWIEDRGENLASAGHSRQEAATVRIAIGDDLAITAITADHTADVGAYPIIAAVMDPLLLPGPYKIPRLGFASRCVWTNTMGTAAYRGPWMFETTAREMAIDHAARVAGLDPIELRRRNLLSAADLPFTSPGGYIFREITPLETLERALEVLGYEDFRARQAQAREQGRLLGLGCCAFVEPTASGAPTQASDGVRIWVDTDGRVTAAMGTTSHGQSVETTMAQVIADALGVSYDDVTIMQGQTEGTPYGRGTGGSGTAVIAGGAARRAAELLRERLLEVAAHLLEADPRILDISDGLITARGGASEPLRLADVAKAAYRFDRQLPPDVDAGLEATARFRPARFPTWANATHLCVVDVEPRTCVVTIERYIVAEDCGAVINPQVVEGQVYGGVVQGIGGVLYEHFAYDSDGNPLTTTLADYLLPTAAEAPPVEISHVESRSTTNPGGFKGAGEGGAIGAHAAVANAVGDALAHLGIHVTATPLGPREIHELLAGVR
jgi:carbon-monoxide dehydrogenase large subunit